MKALLKKKYIFLTSVPKKDIPNGLKVVFKKPYNKSMHPIATADIYKDKIAYSLPPLFKGNKIINVAIRNDTISKTP